MKIYIAGPFFKKEEREYLNQMIDWVRQNYPNDELFIPMDHKIPDGENMPNNEWAIKVFEMDLEAIDKCNLMIALYLGHYSDTGTAWEIGYAQAKEKPVRLYIPEECRENDMSMMPISFSYLIDCDECELNQK